MQNFKNLTLPFFYQPKCISDYFPFYCWFAWFYLCAVLFIKLSFGIKKNRKKLVYCIITPTKH
jgi:hypothetical protein